MPATNSYIVVYADGANVQHRIIVIAPDAQTVMTKLLQALPQAQIVSLSLDSTQVYIAT